MRSLYLLIALAMVGKGMAQQAGELDLSFDGDGKVVLSDFDSIGAPVVVPTADLGVVIAFQQIENGQSVTRIVRLLEDGSPNLGFGTNGVVTTTTLGTFTDLAIQGDGKPVLLGQIASAGDTGMVVERFMESGTADGTYGIDGRTVVNGTNALPPGAKGSTILPDDRLLLQLRDRIVRLKTDGSIDPDFGVQGVLFAPTLVSELTLTSTGRLRWPTLGRLLRDEVDYNGQDSTIGYHLEGPFAVDDNQLEGRFATNCHDESFGESGGYFSPTLPGVGLGVGRAWDLRLRYSHFPWLPPQYSGFMSCAVLFGIGPTGGTWGSIGPLCTDQEGGCLVSYVVSEYMGWPGDPLPLPPVWRVKRIEPLSGDWDPEYGIGPGSPPLQVGTGTAFGTQAPTPRSMVVQPDGKVVLAGDCFVSGAYRIVLARYHNIPDPRSTLSLRMFLGGAYDESTGLMRDDLRQQDLVPDLQPYTTPFFSASNGVGSWATPQHVLEVVGDSAVVDWVWLELLSSADSSNVVATRVGLLHRNGWVTSADGHSPIDFSAGAGSYFVRARHRNHLSVTASQAITLGPGVSNLDLTDPATATFGTDAQKEINGVRMLWPGDANSDGAVKYVGPLNDRDRILIAIGGTATSVVNGYRTEDLNLDGETKYVGPANDRDIILQTIGGTVPTAVRVAQQP